MKAILVTAFGDSSVLKLTDIPRPEPKAGEVLVRLKTSGINFADIYIRNGARSVAMPLPFTLGMEGAGVVEGLGDDVSEVKLGDRVAFSSSPGSYAEYVVIDAKRLIPLPDDISFEQGAAFPLQGMTAHYLLHDYYHINPGTQVLVHAAAGGMGLLLVQWLKHMGARVIGTVSTDEKAKLAKAAGADEIIIYTKQNFVDEVKKLTNGKGVDFILDGVGKDTFTKDLDAVRVYGTVCIFGKASGPADPLPPNLLQVKSLTISGGNLMNSVTTREEILTRSRAVLQGLREGWLKLNIGHIFPLEQAAEAQRLLESRQTTGKVILRIGD